MEPLGPSADGAQRLESRALNARIGRSAASGRDIALLQRAGDRRIRWHNRTVSSTARDETVAAGFAARVQEQEASLLSPLAARSYPPRRARDEEDCSLRTPFQRDRDRIVHCKAFRRLTHKTQVFVAPRGDHYRTRLTHTLEVTTISRTVARALRLNEDLVEAIGLGHDLGHPPFGHIGEEVLDECVKQRFGLDFRHYEHSLRVVDRLERDGQGLNLTEQVRDGIVRHSSRAPQPQTLEGAIVRTIDRVAYINHDIDDAVRAGLLLESDLPAEPIAVLGRSGSARIDALVHDMVEQSARAGEIVQGPDAGPAMAALREFMFERVYMGPAVRAEHERIARVVRRLFEHYVENPQELPGAAGGARGDERALAQRVTDYLAGMTDRYCIARFTELEVPQAFAR
jgi:dGTPase